jgi:hypothetical protein
VGLALISDEAFLSGVNAIANMVQVIALAYIAAIVSGRAMK